MIRIALFYVVMSLAIINCAYFIYKNQADKGGEMVDLLQEDETYIADHFFKADRNAASIQSNEDNVSQQQTVTGLTYSKKSFSLTKKEDVGKEKDKHLIVRDAVTSSTNGNMATDTSYGYETGYDPVTSLPETAIKGTGYREPVIRKLFGKGEQPEYCNHLQLLSNNSEYNSLIEEGKKVIYQSFAWSWRPERLLVGGFSGCEYSNCVVQQCNKFKYVERANLLLFDTQSTSSVPIVPVAVRMTQTWVLHAMEAPAWSWNRVPEEFGTYIDVTDTYRSDSDIYRP